MLPLRRSRFATCLYVCLLGALTVGWVGIAHRRPELVLADPDGLVIAVLVAVALGCYGGVEVMFDRLGRAFDPSAGLVIVALLLSGPLAALVVLVIPDLVRVLRRPAFGRELGLLANLVSHVASVLIASWALSLLYGASLAGSAIAVLCAGVGITLANYVFARLLFAVLRDRANPIELIRSELLSMLPVELAVIALTVVCVLLAPVIGILALAPFAGVVIVPQLAVGRLLKTRSIARLEVNRAAAVYRAALSDQLLLPRSTRRAIEQSVCLLDGDPVARGSDLGTRQAIGYALEAQICLSRPPVQPAYTAQLPTQVLLIAGCWAQLTARGTRALSHSEALAEIASTTIIADAPEAFDAAFALAQRETALTNHSTAVPRLHALRLPRSLRGQRLVTAVDQLRAQPG
jgi:riboflavin transporter FmnP